MVGLLRGLASPELGGRQATQPLVALIDDARWHVERSGPATRRFGSSDGDVPSRRCALLMWI